jgi:putative hemolysin
MRKYSLLAVLSLLVLVLAACVAGTPATPAPVPTPEPPPAAEVPPAVAPAPAYFGVFSALLPAADSPGRTVTAEVTEDGTVTVTSDYQNGQAPIVETGTWAANADGSLTVTLTEQDGQAYFEPQTFQVVLDEATGELTVAGAGGAEFTMTPGAAAPAGEAAEPAPAEVAPPPADLAGAYSIIAPDGGVLTFVLADDGAIRATIAYPDGSPSTVISGTWQANADGTAMATLTEQDGQTFEPQQLLMALDPATDELVLAAATGEELRLARTSGEAAAPPVVSTPITPTVEVTGTAVVTATAPATTTKAVTATAALTTTETVTATAALTATGTMTSTVASVAETLENTYIAALPAASGGGSRLIALHLHPDGTARMATDYQTDDPPVIELGSWQDNGDGTLTVTLTGQEDEPYDEPVVITFEQDGELLRAVEYDTTLYGSEGLTLVRAADVTQALNTSLITINLQAGFPLDPTFVSVNAGGQVDASVLIADCEGFINTEPVVTVEWSGTAPFVKAFFVSDDDPTMVVGTPDGRLLCNDDANDQLLDPRIRIDDPITGTYKIWLGSYARNQLIPGVLVLTTKEDVTLASFDLGSFIKRPPLPETAVEPTAVASPTVPSTATLKIAVPELTTAGPITVSLVASGTIPVFQMNLEDPTCNGLVTGVPDYVFSWSGDPGQVRVFFEGDADATLLVYGGADKALACADDHATGNANPSVAFENAAQGLYGVWVGRLDPSKPVQGVLTITTDPDAAPVILEPAQPASGSTGMANPASVYCEQQGGTVDIRTAADGSQTGYCVFADGSECDEWAFFRGQCKPGQAK